MKDVRGETPRFRGAPVDMVVDVRSKIEFWLGHLPGAMCIPVQDLPDALTQQDGFSPQQRILVYCASGARSAAAARQLRAVGCVNVVDGGGIADARKHFAP